MDNNAVVYELDIIENNGGYTSSIDAAFTQADKELQALEETIESIKGLKPDCDKLDYALSAGSGAICGLLDIFFVGKPGESPLGDITDKWFADRTKDFAKLCDWKNAESGSLASAIQHLEQKFKIPYDQRGMGDAGSAIFDLTASNHHFKSLGHNPTLLGLFFSILDQFANQSHFVTEGELVSLNDASGVFALRGRSVPEKLFCGFVNWFGHLISDASGSSGSKTRGMGIPSPIWAWTNDIIAIRRKLNIPATDFDRSLNEVAVEIYKKRFDLRFQAAQMIPVLINELIIRLFYSIRRTVQYFRDTEKGKRSFAELWKHCEPFSNPTVKRMLTVGHGVFCALDIGDATIRGFVTGGGSFNPVEFFLRLNLPGLGRFTISLYGEVKRGIAYKKAEDEAIFARREKTILLYYIDGLQTLADLYRDEDLVSFVHDFKTSDLYIAAFEKSVVLAEKRLVPETKILKTKSDIDSYFNYSGENKNG